ncbi:MAG: polysaccharide deacetylase family protein [Polyangiales bacterium]
MRLMRPLLVLSVCALAFGVLPSRRVALAKSSSTSRSRGRKAAFRLAVTVDDLPGGGPEIAEFSHVRIVSDIIATLQAHHVKRPAGFVVGSMLEGHPERQDALDAWVGAGFEVGNHSYSHRSLFDLGLNAFLDDVAKNRAVTDPLEKLSGQSVRYFRYPYLDEGRSETERRALARFLGSNHYTVARVSIDFADWGYADAYGRCLRHQNSHALELLGQSYIANAIASLQWSMAVAHEVLGHSIPYVLLLHANVATEHFLDELLTRYEDMGARYVPLSEALAEPAYTASYSTPGGNVLVEASKELKRPRSPGLPRPLELLDLACEERPVTPPLL